MRLYRSSKARRQQSTAVATHLISAQLCDVITTFFYRYSAIDIEDLQIIIDIDDIFAHMAICDNIDGRVIAFLDAWTA